MPARPFSCSNCCGEYLPFTCGAGRGYLVEGVYLRLQDSTGIGRGGCSSVPRLWLFGFCRDTLHVAPTTWFAILPPCATLACRDCPGVRMGRSGFGARAGPGAPPCPLSDYKSGPGMWTRATSTAQRVMIVRQFGITDAREPVGLASRRRHDTPTCAAARLSSRPSFRRLFGLGISVYNPRGSGGLEDGNATSVV